jgi:hypothetical protein
MKQRGNTIVIVLILIIAAAAVGFLVYQNMQLRKQTATPSPVPTASVSIVPTPGPTQTPSPSLKPGWKLYQNEQYGFEFSYPESYKVLTDSENLYGWPKAILLLYKGGQSYDMPVEVWDTEAQYKAKYINTSDLTVFKTKDGKFITLANPNKDPEVSEIISTFKFTE